MGGAKRGDGQNHRDARKEVSLPVTRAEFDRVVKLLEEHGDVLDELQRAVHAACRDLAEDVRRNLQTQFTRIVQLQQEIDSLKRRA